MSRCANCFKREGTIKAYASMRTVIEEVKVCRECAEELARPPTTIAYTKLAAAPNIEEVDDE